MSRLVAVLGGGDWADASVDFLKVPDRLDLVAAKARWQAWYDTTYLPALREWQRNSGGAPTFLTFSNWLAQREGCEANPDEIETFNDV